MCTLSSYLPYIIYCLLQFIYWMCLLTHTPPYILVLAMCPLFTPPPPRPPYILDLALCTLFTPLVSPPPPPRPVPHIYWIWPCAPCLAPPPPPPVLHRLQLYTGPSLVTFLTPIICSILHVSGQTFYCLVCEPRLNWFQTLYLVLCLTDSKHGILFCV